MLQLTIGQFDRCIGVQSVAKQVQGNGALEQ